MNKLFKAFVIGSALSAIISIGSVASASPMFGDTLNFNQPNGTSVEINVFGDEFYHFSESWDGYTLIKEPSTGWYCYAKLDITGNELISTGVKYLGKVYSTDSKNIKKTLKKGIRINRSSILDKVKSSDLQIKNDLNDNQIPSPKRAPLINEEKTKTIKSVTILIDFKDTTSPFTTEDIDSFINQNGYSLNGNNGSVRDYFRDVSGGAIDYSTQVVGYYHAPEDKAFYDTPTLYHRGIRKLVMQALIEMDKTVDFSNLTKKDDGTATMLNIMYAGEPMSGDLWPHSYYLDLGSPLAFDFSYTCDGMTFNTYTFSAICKTPTLKTIIHENGHGVFDWPDLYDIDYTSRGAGNFCLMAAGGNNKNPVPPCSYLRYLAGWGKTVDLKTMPNGAKISFDKDTIYKYTNNSDPSEFFMIENITKTDRREYIPDEGLMILHIDENMGSKTMNDVNTRENMLPASHYRVSVEQADGLFELEHCNNYGNNNDLYDASDKTEFNQTTIPNSNWWSGSASGLQLKDIGNCGGSMSFTYNNSFAPEFKTTISSTIPFKFGDVSGDMEFDSADLNIMRSFLIGKISNFDAPWGKFAADVNNDGTIDSADHTTIRKALLGKEELPVNQLPVSTNNPLTITKDPANNTITVNINNGGSNRIIVESFENGSNNLSVIVEKNMYTGSFTFDADSSKTYKITYYDTVPSAYITYSSLK